MRRRDDDLSAWSDDPIVRALTAPGSPEELAGEASALAAFRSSVTPSRRRFAGRFGAGGATFAVAVALSGGVAAAYGHVLPAPIQHIAADVLPGAPGDGHHHHGWGHHQRHHQYSAQGASAGASHLAGSAPIPPASAGSGTNAPAPTASTAAPSPSESGKAKTTSSKKVATTAPSTSPTAVATPTPGTPTPTPTTSGSANPTPTPTRTPAAKPGKITMSLAATKVVVGGNDTVTAHVSTSAGDPLAGRQVWLAQRLTGTTSWQRVAGGTTDGNGVVTLTLPDVTHNVYVRVTTGNGVRSGGQRVVVLPRVTVSTSRNGDHVDVTVTADGAQVGDGILVQRRQNGKWVEQQSLTLGGGGSATFAVPAPPAKRKQPVHYRVVLKATRDHGYAATAFTVSAT